MDAADLSTFHALIESCAGLGEPFSLFASGMPPSKWPLPVTLTNNDERILFASTYDPRSEAPRLGLDLAELMLLPTEDAVESWGADSSWAYTRCEILGHELAEAVEYARLVKSRAEADRTPDVRFALLQRGAHRAGIAAEHAIAALQRTRLDANGQPYGRTRHCFIEQQSRRPAVAIVLGGDSVLLELTQSNIKAIRYLHGIDACAVL